MSNSFVHLEYSTSHPGVERLERVIHAAEGLRKGWSATRGLAGVLLAAMVATLVVVADRLMDTWADGHLLAAWVLMWVIGFSALALLAPTARGIAARVMAGLDGWSQNVARRRADERLWDLARKDPRVMADIQAASSRAEEEASGPQGAPSGRPEIEARVLRPEITARLKRLSRRIWNE
ncbi:MAG: hypothetical protein VW475_05220 [Curvibacter sp.]